MSGKSDVVEDHVVSDKVKWRAEDEIVLETIQKAHLKISRIIFDKESPPKRCMAFSKNRKSVAFDLEMVPIVVVYMIKMTPLSLIPKEFRTEKLDKIWKMVAET